MFGLKKTTRNAKCDMMFDSDTFSENAQNSYKIEVTSKMGLRAYSSKGDEKRGKMQFGVRAKLSSHGVEGNGIVTKNINHDLRGNACAEENKLQAPHQMRGLARPPPSKGTTGPITMGELSSRAIGRPS